LDTNRRNIQLAATFAVVFGLATAIDTDRHKIAGACEARFSTH
jgi:hypothetical protein